MKLNSKFLIGFASVLVIAAQFLTAVPINAAALEEKIIFLDGDTNLVSINPDGSGRHVIANSGFFDVSPDGSKIVFTGGDCRFGDICTMDSYGANVTNITPSTSSFHDSSPAWSPDGKKILFSSARSSNIGTFVMNADGSNVNFLISGAFNASWSPDGSKIVFVNGESRISTANSDGTNIQVLTTGNDGGKSPDWSPDGNFIAFVHTEGQEKVTVMNPDGTGRINLVTSPIGGGIGELSWSPDSAKITFTQYLGPDGGSPLNYRIFNTDLSGNTQQIYQEDDGGITNPKWVNIIVDSIPPTTSTFQWSSNPKSTAATSVLTVNAIDEAGGAGIAGGEYFIGDLDPGVGNGAAMSLNGTALTASFGTDLPVGIYDINFRALDNYGNWSEVTTDYLVVYEPGFRITGRRTIVPSLNNGDVLPGLINVNQSDSATFSFNARYDGSGQVSGSSDLKFKYATGSACNGGNPQNCHTIELNATRVEWFLTRGTNNSEGVFQGTATLAVDGLSSTVQFRVTGVDGTRLNATSQDHITIFIYAQGDDPNSSSPIYKVSSNVARGNIKITN